MSRILHTLNEEQLSYIEEINYEYSQGFVALNGLPRETVTFYGGGKVLPEDTAYIQTKELASEFARRGWGVVSGGGPGIMAASLEGAQQAGGKAIAFRISISGEPPSVEADVDVLFKHFSPRKYLLRQSDVFVYCPGGFGTLDELMENLTLIVTGKHPAKPIYLLDRKFWGDYIEWFEKMLFEERKTVSQGYDKLFKIVDTKEELIADLFRD
jgi:uncharacterized protein (TIGR00730 family)